MKIIKQIGQGGFGKVEEVEIHGGKFALKTFSIHPSMKGIEEHAKKRFIKEAKYQEQIKHPNIVTILEVNTSVEPPYYIMNLADSSLEKDMISGKIDSTNFLPCIYDIMAGLEEIHSLNIYHRDLKPGNVLRFNKTYSIGDFGLMSIDQTGVSSLTSTGMAKTSDFYTAPEITQDLKHASIRSDIYSLGCILHDFVGQTKRIPCNEISEASDYGDLLLSATRKDPKRRFESVSAFREALNSITKSDVKTKTVLAEKILDSLRKDEKSFNKKDIIALSDFLSSNVSDEEKNIILSEIKIVHIKKIIEEDIDKVFIAKKYCEYVRENHFNWDFGDTLSNRIIEFMKIDEIDILSEGIFALLYMGTRHNRWYVEGKSASFLSGEIEKKLLQRLIMEIRVDGPKFCSALSHLSHSINYNIDNLNPEIRTAVKEICKK